MKQIVQLIILTAIALSSLFVEAKTIRATEMDNSK
jgi:hypothetical protein